MLGIIELRWGGSRRGRRRPAFHTVPSESKRQEGLGPPEMSQVYGRGLQIQQVVLMFGGRKSFLPHFDTSTGLPEL